MSASLGRKSGGLPATAASPMRCSWCGFLLDSSEPDAPIAVHPIPTGTSGRMHLDCGAEYAIACQSEAE